jgi:hypothetical protein
MAGHIPAATWETSARREIDNVGKIMMVNGEIGKHKLKSVYVK